MPEMTYVEAVNAALRRALNDDPKTLLYGEDVGEPGGVFGASKGLRKEFGARVFDTPISEAAILGSAIGAAMFGFRPIVEIMWIDFTLVALDQVVNQAANVRYVSRGRLTAPLTIRTQQGALPGSCAQHSQNLEAFFAHVPGLVVCAPSNAQDAHDLLLSAIKSDDPALVIENRSLYFGGKHPVDVDREASPVGGARVTREGSDVTIVSWSATAVAARAAADTLAEEGIDAEIIDLRWLLPLDTETVTASVEKTGRLLVAHEANVTGGLGAEITARVAEQSLYHLDAPPVRIGVPDCRIPAAPVLQRALLPNADTIASGARALVKT